MKETWQAPGETLWRGRQWAVTTYGLETISEPYHYHMTAQQIQSLRSESGILDSMQHMMEKNWLDVDDFFTAYLVALALHSKAGETARTSIKKAIKARQHLYGREVGEGHWTGTKRIGEALGGDPDPEGGEP